MKKLVFAMVIVCVTVTFFTPSSGIADELENLKQSLKDCNSGSCLENLQNKAEQIFDRVGKNFDNDFVEISNEISINHCRSLIQEMFYHMKTLKSYYNFKNVFYLKELKKLKENRARLDREKITSNDFNRMTRQIEEQYKDDIEASQNFVNDKIWRLQGLCDNLNGNVETTQGRVRLKSGTLSESLAAHELAHVHAFPPYTPGVGRLDLGALQIVLGLLESSVRRGQGSPGIFELRLSQCKG